jgi:uncharacterized protein YjiS (DUF1127 family)
VRSSKGSIYSPCNDRSLGADGTSNHAGGICNAPRLPSLRGASGATTFGPSKKTTKESVMEMHWRRSHHEIHGIHAQSRRQLRRPPIAQLAIAQILIALRRMIRAFEAELAARHAITELAGSDERMLRDLGITRSEIESVVRGFRARDDGPVLSNDAYQSRSALPTISSPDLTPGGRPERQLLRLSSW